MEVEKLSDFLKNCCRVCLSIENEMVDSTNIVENFNKTIEQLLLECANLRMTSESNPKKLCEDCTTELVMVAKFREKCSMSSIALEQLRRQINKMTKIEESDAFQTAITDSEQNSNTNGEAFYESIEYAEENVEYVIYDTGSDLLEDTEITEKPQIIDINNTEDYNTNSTISVGKESTTPKKLRHETTKVKLNKNETIESKPATNSVIKHHCKLCGAAFAQINNYTRHLQTHNDHEMEMETENALEQDQTTTSSSQKIKKTHTCQYCSRAFPSLSLLATHIRIHTGERPFQCDVCTKSFKTQGALDLHMRRHSGVKPYKCSECNRGFVESSNLKVHMRTHTGYKPHICITCGRSFSRVFLLQIHQRTHTGEKPYGCPICEKSFAQQGDLAAHKRIHSGERPHICNVCHKGFIKSSGLTQHMRRHFRPTSKTNISNPSNDTTLNDQVEFSIEESANSDDTKSGNVIINYKEYEENPETFDSYLKNYQS